MNGEPISKTMPSFYDSQNEEIKMVIAGIFKEFPDLDAFDKWMENEEIEFKKPPTQEDIKRGSTSQSIPTTTRDPTPSNLSVKTITSETNKNPNICDAIAIDIGTSKFKLIDEPIAVAAAYAPKLNIHPKGDVALVFCMGAGYLQVAAYFIRQEIHEETQEEKAKWINWTDWVINKISGIEPIVKNFAGDDIDRLIFDKMMDKVTQQMSIHYTELMTTKIMI
ncbi:hypothetical protein WR25_19191 [Diploscapter pachys]|uniref:Uncharacterized protein n=1 Tax=Diploscapter pachys TaxID=2018661 RepID=A0A2A2JF12_9BILA|nr:hypothetical protein WR25_19191 [Diploscapter pachys]